MSDFRATMAEYTNKVKIMTTEKARIAQVNLFGEEVEALMLPNGDFAIGVSQVGKLFPDSISQTNETRRVKALLCVDSPLVKVTSELHFKPVNILSLEQFEKLIVALAKLGDKKALDLTFNLVGLSLIQLCSDAFGVKFETEERKSWVKFRSAHKKQYHPKLTIWFKADGCEGVEYGVRMNQFKAQLGLPIKKIDQYTEEQLDKLNEAEVEYHVLRRSGLPHNEAMKLIG
jgi:hypothetical protein